MRKTTKTITEVTHEYGVISFELPLYEKLMNVANLDSVRDEHIDLIIEKTKTISEQMDGAPLTSDNYTALVAGTPAAVTPSAPSIVSIV